MTNFERVGEFHRKFDLPVRDGSEPSRIIPDPEFLFRYHFILEEAVELLAAHRAGDVVKAADALVDLLYVVYGLAHYMNVPADGVFEIVHAANMKKVRASGSDDPRGTRNSALDVVKPEGWEPPDLSEILL